MILSMREVSIKISANIHKMLTMRWILRKKKENLLTVLDIFAAMPGGFMESG